MQRTPSFYPQCLVIPEHLSSLMALYTIAGQDSAWPELGHARIPADTETGNRIGQAYPGPAATGLGLVSGNSSQPEQLPQKERCVWCSQKVGGKTKIASIHQLISLSLYFQDIHTPLTLVHLN